MEKYIQTAPILIIVVLLVVGFTLLIKGADMFVDGSSSLAHFLKIPTIIVGLTVVAMGTSLPEAAVSATASIANNNELAISNAIGSNIFNLMIVIGICALFSPIIVGMDTIKRDIPISALCATFLIGMGFINLKITGTTLSLERWSGIVLIVLFALYIINMIRLAYKGVEVAGEEVPDPVSLPKSLIFIIIGGLFIALGGDLTVDVAARIASEFGMSQTLIGLTIVSIGTSLPELITSIVAAKKKELDLALGNAIGSNVFNILMVLGIATSISPIEIIPHNIIDIVILLIFTLVVWIFSITKREISRKEGIIMIALYVLYFIYINIR